MIALKSREPNASLTHQLLFPPLMALYLWMLVLDAMTPK